MIHNTGSHPSASCKQTNDDPRGSIFIFTIKITKSLGFVSRSQLLLYITRKKGIWHNIYKHDSVLYIRKILTHRTLQLKLSTVVLTGRLRTSDRESCPTKKAKTAWLCWAKHTSIVWLKPAVCIRFLALCSFTYLNIQTVSPPEMKKKSVLPNTEEKLNLYTQFYNHLIALTPRPNARKATHRWENANTNRAVH